MKWTFESGREGHTAEWRSGAMRCTMPEVIAEADRLISLGEPVMCGSATNLVTPSLQDEAGGYAVITTAIQKYADFGSLVAPRSYATIVTDVIIADEQEELEKNRPRKFSTREEAARYAAQVRWGNKYGDMVIDSHATEQMFTQLWEQEKPEAKWAYDDKFAVERYALSGAVWNDRLRTENPQTAERVGMVGTLTTVFDKLPATTADCIVVRGIMPPRSLRSPSLAGFRALKNLKEGSSFVDRGFLSTSTRSNIEEQFFGSNGIRFEIVLPKGSKVLPIFKSAGRRDNLREYEVLLPRNSRFKVLSRKEERGGTTMRVLFEGVDNAV